MSLEIVFNATTWIDGSFNPGKGNGQPKKMVHLIQVKAPKQDSLSSDKRNQIDFGSTILDGDENPMLTTNSDLFYRVEMTWQI